MTLPRVGEPAPEFHSLDDSGKQISLRDYRGPCVVMFFYPKDDTPR